MPRTSIVLLASLFCLSLSYFAKNWALSWTLIFLGFVGGFVLMVWRVRKNIQSWLGKCPNCDKTVRVDAKFCRYCSIEILP